MLLYVYTGVETSIVDCRSLAVQTHPWNYTIPERRADEIRLAIGVQFLAQFLKLLKSISTQTITDRSGKEIDMGDGDGLIVVATGAAAAQDLVDELLEELVG